MEIVCFKETKIKKNFSRNFCREFTLKQIVKNSFE